MARSFCHLLILVNHALVANLGLLTLFAKIKFSRKRKLYIFKEYRLMPNRTIKLKETTLKGQSSLPEEGVLSYNKAGLISKRDIIQKNHCSFSNNYLP